LWHGDLEDEMRAELRHAIRLHIDKSATGRNGQDMELFQLRWRRLLEGRSSRQATVLEVPCGSANDYRHFHSYGLARHMNYTGVDLCQTNICNARAMFPNTTFEHGNVFDLEPFGSHDYVFVADLFEHLSCEGIEAAVSQVVAAATKGIVVNFFAMSRRLHRHVYRTIPDRHYYWNTLSLSVMMRLFAATGMQVTPIVLSDYVPPIGDLTHYSHRVTFIVTKTTPGTARRHLSQGSEHLHAQSRPPTGA
jgi:SAM-dependent methyltransferase